MYDWAKPIQTFGKAIASMVCGILSIITSGAVVPGIVLGIIGIVFGNRARKEIKKSDNPLKGEGMATAGFVCGIVGVVFSVIMGWILVMIIITLDLFSCLQELYW